MITAAYTPTESLRDQLLGMWPIWGNAILALLGMWVWNHRPVHRYIRKIGRDAWEYSVLLANGRRRRLGAAPTMPDAVHALEEEARGESGEEET